VLRGKISGLTNISNSGQPGDDAKMLIRGTGTVNNSTPLYIVDGIQIDGNINFLNPSDIASVEVLKDAASAAIYGTRGANGVIMIRTKTGEKGKPRINYDFSYGWQNPWKTVEVLNAREYMTLMNEMYVQDNSPGKFFTAEQMANAKTTDWQKELFNSNAPVINHNVSVNGATENNAYAISFGYFNQEGIVGGNVGRSNLERYNFRINDTQQAFQTDTRSFLNKLKVGVTAAYTHSENTGVTANDEFGAAPLGNALTFAPYVPVYAENPDEILAAHPEAVVDNEGRVFSLSPAGFQEVRNPIAMLYVPNGTFNYQDVLVGSVWGELDIIDGLKFHSSYSIDMSNWGDRGWNFPYYLNNMAHIDIPDETQNQTSVSMSKSRRFYWQAENYFSFDKTFAEKHTVNVVLGQGAQKSTLTGISGSRAATLFDPDYAWINNQAENKTYYSVNGWGNIEGSNSGNGASFRSLASYFARLNYSFDERYILSGTVRRDGSSRFGANKKWGVFPSVSVAWNIMNEPYILNKPQWIDAAKLRVSWGRNGNDRIEELRYASYDSRGGAHDYYFNSGFDLGSNSWTGTLISGVQPGALSNPDLRWEQSEQTNLGLDLSLFRGALNFNFDYFYKYTDGMLQEAIVPRYAGQSAPWANVGTMENKGLEFELGYKGRAGKLNYFVNTNVSYVKNKLIEYGNATGIQSNIENNGASGIGEYMRGENGLPYPFFYGLKTNGIFQNWDEINNYTYTYIEEASGLEVTQLIQPNAVPGDVRFVDFDNNGEITTDDKTMIGKPLPDWTYGISVGGEYKGFDFNMFWQGSYGFDIFQFTTRGDVAELNRRAWFLDRWHGEGTSNRLPRMASTSNRNLNWQSSDLFLSDGSYIRLKTIQLGYSLPSGITQKAAIQKLRFYVAAYNLFTVTAYEGYDVEIGGRSIDKGVYPQSRTISIGANLIF
jgi:TonB-linked SusC/RagA family outer membrane protein